jgi:hypothetical protein
MRLEAAELLRQPAGLEYQIIQTQSLPSRPRRVFSCCIATLIPVMRQEQ